MNIRLYLYSYQVNITIKRGTKINVDLKVISTFFIIAGVKLFANLILCLGITFEIEYYILNFYNV